MEKEEFRVLIKHCYLMGKNAAQTQKWLLKCYPDSAPSEGTVRNWIRKFKCGETSTSDGARPGRPKEVTTDEMATKVHDIVMKDRKLTLQEIADAVGISKGRTHHILHEILDMRKIIAKWVPRNLTADQKRQRVTTSEAILEMFRANRQDVIRRIITVNETWIHTYTPEDKQKSAEWTGFDEKQPSRPKAQQSAEKVLASVFWDHRGILMIDYMPKGKTINSLYYCELLEKLMQTVAVKRPELQKKKVLFLQDNAPAHKSILTMAKINDLRIELVAHPPYSPDLAPSDYYLFPNLKRYFQGQRFQATSEVVSATEGYFEGLGKDYFLKGIEMLEKRWTRCVELQGDYVE